MEEYFGLKRVDGKQKKTNGTGCPVLITVSQTDFRVRSVTD